jgi:hypothetical protein
VIDMSGPTLEKLEERIATLEAEVRRIQQRDLVSTSDPQKPWWERRFGVFKDDPLYDEAMRLGAEYRRSQPAPADKDDVPS